MLNWFKKQKKDFIDIPTADVMMLGESAQRLLENVAFKVAIKRIENDYFQIWKASKPLENEGREAVWHGVQAIAELKIKLQGMINQMIVEKQKTEEGGVYGRPN